MESFTRAWYRYPNAVRIEGGGSASDFPATWAEPIADPLRPIGPSMTPMAQPGTSATVPAPLFDAKNPDLRHMIDREEGELLQPEGLIHTLDFHIVERGRHIDREVLRGRGAADWSRLELEFSDVMLPAEEYDFLVDVEAGILLRFACLLDGTEFSTQEVLYLEIDLADPRSRRGTQEDE